MALSEFALIERYFRSIGQRRADVRLGIGDDAALLQPTAGAELVAAIDTLVEGIHFPRGCTAASIGHRALAVNLSDLAAMGAQPAWALLALTLPTADDAWLNAFATGFSQLARAHHVALVGGDTTSGPLCVSVQVLGHVAPGTAMLRSGGKPGDILFVSGSPGDAAAGLAVEQGRLSTSKQTSATLRERFLFPTPRVVLGERLREFASACIDVSDGLLGDAGKLAIASGCGAQLDYRRLPVSAALRAAVGDARARELALTGGDDYELCFSVPRETVETLHRQLPPETWCYHSIGVLREAHGTVVMDADSTVMHFSHCGFDHFASRIS